MDSLEINLRNLLPKRMFIVNLQPTIVCLAVITFVSQAMAQITLSLHTDRQRYIRFEPVKATISVKNYSGESLHFQPSERENKDFIKLKITNTAGKSIPGLSSDVVLSEDLVLPPGGTRLLELMLSDFFDIQKEDDYELTVRVGYHRFEHDYVSYPVQFQIRAGVKIWSRRVGFPEFEDKEYLESRLCSLNTIHYEDGDLYFLQIEDNDYVYTTLRLGPRVLGIAPQCEVDAFSRIHTLIQTAPRLINYRIVDLNGQVKQNNYYVIEKSLPTLFRDADLGTVSVQGGRQAIEGVDFNVMGQASEEPAIPMDVPSTTR